MDSSSTIIYYTANMEKVEFEAKIIDNLKKQAGDIPIISVSRKPIDLGKNICVGEQPVCYSNSFKQILIGLKEAKTDFCIAAESDVLYPPEYFQFTPRELNRVYRYDNLYVHFDGRDKFWKKSSVEGAQMCGREYWIECIEKILDDNWMPQKVNPPFVFPLTGEGYFTGINPVLYFKTREGIGFKTGYDTKSAIKELPYWGNAQQVYNNYLK